MTPMQSAPGDRVLVMMRHAKAESWGDSDHDRRLTDRGRGDAAAAGRWLAQQGFTPDHALVSSAARTQETWDAVAAGAGWDLVPVFDDGLYTAAPDTALDLMRETPDEARSLIMIGHNPTVAYLAQMLDDGAGDPASTADMAGGYPTSAMTMLTFTGPWAALDMASASVVAFHVGRG